jgi:hypothetical protein
MKGLVQIRHQAIAKADVVSGYGFGGIAIGLRLAGGKATATVVAAEWRKHAHLQPTYVKIAAGIANKTANVVAAKWDAR